MSQDPARILISLQNTGLQNKDNPLYQVLRDLIKIVTSLNIITPPNNFSGGGSTTNITNFISQAYDPGTLIIPDEHFLIQYKILKLNGSERLTLEGTARVIIEDF